MFAGLKQSGNSGENVMRGKEKKEMSEMNSLFVFVGFYNWGNMENTPPPAGSLGEKKLH